MTREEYINTLELDNTELKKGKSRAKIAIIWYYALFR